MNYTPETAKPSKPSETLVVLSILTFIGCAFGLFIGLKNFVGATESYQKMLQAHDQLQNGPGFLKALTGPGMIEIARKSMVNRVPILIFQLIGLACCVYGVILMRSLKKRGFYIYLFGELLPTVNSLVFVGVSLLSGIFVVVGLVIALVFIALYANQLKSMS